ncbi:hypothetical protein FNW02_34570 [Komarekiella sp. 'clone 1']|uniref:Uncharacterized protein n=1 Tax=Komarekiella delphini-convector SJRDD-AB1 TaxID=2593771 RepID=A0AA40T4G7_9NOST|nr:hypothetical protein [Komarekiella delphini-convector]MBD6620749.1 hypothetical protein [Komarekiella delphini-convector SJRDD-AB1]
MVFKDMQTYSSRAGLPSDAMASGIKTKRRIAAERNTVALMGVAGALMIAEMSLHNMMMGGIIILTAVAVTFQKEFTLVLTGIDSKQRKYGVNLYAILFCLLAFVFVLDFASAPASAQFFNNAEDWLVTNFPNAAGNTQTQETIETVFNIIRALFLLYIAISIVNIIQAVRRDEDWATPARTPFIMVVAVFAADILTGLVAGGAGG